MHKKDRLALIVGVVLGISSCFLIFISGIAAGAVLLGTLILCPLITSIIAAQRIFLSGLAPNILIAIGGSIFGASSPYNRTAEDVLLVILSMLGLSIVCALLMAGLVWFVRKKIM